MSGFRPRTPPPPPPPQPPRIPSPPPPPSPRPIPPADGSRPRELWIPVSDWSYVTASGDTCIVQRNYTGSITITRDAEGKRVVKEEPKEQESSLPPFTSLLRPGSSGRTPPPRPPPPASSRTPPPRPPPPRCWVSPQSQRPETPAPRDPPPPYQGIVVTEGPHPMDDLPHPYGEVLVDQRPIGVRGN